MLKRIGLMTMVLGCSNPQRLESDAAVADTAPSDQFIDRPATDARLDRAPDVLLQDDTSDGANPDAQTSSEFRQLFPPNFSRLSGNNITFEWTGDAALIFERCAVPDCSTTLDSVSATRTLTLPSLPNGRHYWRLVGTNETSPIFSFFVQGSGTPYVVGHFFDVENDGYEDFVSGDTRIGGFPIMDRTGVSEYFRNNGTTFESTVLSGPSVPGDRFGETVLPAGDLNGDGFADVAITSPYEQLPEVRLNGRIIVPQGPARIYVGRANGLAGSANQLISAALNPTPTRIGRSLVAGDFDRDGFGDLAVAIRPNPIVGRFEQYIYWGSSAGVDPNPEVFGVASDTPFSSALAASCDLNGDGFEDIVSSLVDHRTLHMSSFANRQLTRHGAALAAGGSLVNLRSMGDLTGDGRCELGATINVGTTGPSFQIRFITFTGGQLSFLDAPILVGQHPTPFGNDSDEVAYEVVGAVHVYDLSTSMDRVVLTLFDNTLSLSYTSTGLLVGNPAYGTGGGFNGTRFGAIRLVDWRNEPQFFVQGPGPTFMFGWNVVSSN